MLRRVSREILSAMYPTRLSGSVVPIEYRSRSLQYHRDRWIVHDQLLLSHDFMTLLLECTVWHLQLLVLPFSASVNLQFINRLSLSKFPDVKTFHFWWVFRCKNIWHIRHQWSIRVVTSLPVQRFARANVPWFSLAFWSRILLESIPWFAVQ